MDTDPQALRDAARFFLEIAGWTALILIGATLASIALGLVRLAGHAQQMQDDGE